MLGLELEISAKLARAGFRNVSAALASHDLIAGLGSTERLSERE